MLRKAAILSIVVWLTLSIADSPFLQLTKRVHAAGRTWTVTSTSDSGNGTLRWCLLNATSGDTITFEGSTFPPASPATIALTNELPHITQGNLTIDASSAGVILNGSLLPSGTVGLVVDSESNTIKELQIMHFPSWGVRLTTNAYACSIAGNTIVDNVGGITISQSQNNTISGNNITGNHGEGVGIIESEGNLVSGNSLVDNWEGVYLEFSSANTVSDNFISRNAGGVYLNSSSGNLISNNHIEISMGAVHCIASSHNNISGNHILSSGGAVDLYDYSNSNIVLGNNITDNWTGVDLINSSNNLITRNTIQGSDEDGIGLNAFCHYNIIDENTITNNTGDGIEIYNSSNNTISCNNITANTDDGIELSYSSNSNVIQRNRVKDNHEEGIWLYGVSNNTACENDLWGNLNGIYIEGSSQYNNVYGNNIENNDNGTVLRMSSNNFIHKNNFMNNTLQAAVDTAVNSWDDGVEGNYWSDYSGVDPNHEGIGNIPYIIDADNKDNYPLMGPFHRFNTSLGDAVTVVSNSTITYFHYEEFHDRITIQVHNATSGQSFGFVRVSIPHDLINPDITWINVVINDGEVTPLHFNNTLYDNGTHRWIYVAYPHSLIEIVIVPEFPTIIIVLFFIAGTLLMALAYRKRPLEA